MLNDIRYLCRLAWSIVRPRRHGEQGRGHAPRPVFVLGLVVVVLLGAGWLNEGGLTSRGIPAVKVLDARVRTAGVAWREVERAYERDIEPIENVLVKYRDDQELARRIAVALVREGRKADIEPRLLLAVLLVENPWLNPTAQSSVGARGLMQVMPLHRGQWGCGDELEDIDSNICHGAKIFASYLRSSKGDVERALLRYNGCVRGTNTPNCHSYPYHVFARAGRASILALRPTTGRAAAP
jgi:hypothetical protein